MDHRHTTMPRLEVEQGHRLAAVAGGAVLLAILLYFGAAHLRRAASGFSKSSQTAVPPHSKKSESVREGLPDPTPMLNFRLKTATTRDHRKFGVWNVARANSDPRRHSIRQQVHPMALLPDDVCLVAHSSLSSRLRGIDASLSLLSSEGLTSLCTSIVSLPDKEGRLLKG